MSVDIKPIGALKLRPMATQRETQKWRVEDDYHFILSKKIMEDSDMTGVIVFGSQRTGKSTYALQVMYDIYRDWDMVLSRTFFKLEDVVTFIRAQIKADKIIPVFCWDDAGVYGSKQLYFTKRRLAEYLQNLFDVIGTATKGVILTTPSPENLLKAVRSYEFYRIKVIKANQYYRRVATGYKNILLPSGSRVISKKFKDLYDVRLPDDVYEQYIKTRKGYLDEALDNLDEYLAEMKAAKAEKIKGESE